MSNLSIEVLDEAFIRPIRFAMLLDDQFPSYPEALVEERNVRYDYPRATGLFSLCRQQGWLCDVDNRAKIAVQFEDAKHLHQSDLLILDFHLDPANADDPSEALTIIQKLAHSPHFNMVLLYTSEKPGVAIRDVAFALGAGTSPDINDASFWKVVDELDSEIESDISQSINTNLIASFLNGKSLLGEVGDLKKRLFAVGIKPPTQAQLLNHACVERLMQRCSPDVASRRVVGASVVGNFTDEDTVKWLTCNNVFVAVANKNTTEPESILDVLRAALQAWNPTPLQVMMIHARSALEKVGNVSDSAVLSDPARQAGWLLPILLAREGADRDQGLTDLYGRLFGRLINAIGPSVNHVGKMLVNGHTGTPLAVAKALARSEALADKEVYHALNEHLCSEEHPDGSITTGVIFHDAKAQEFWLCTSPACDLVPGRKKGGVLDPWLPIAAVKLTAIKKDIAIIENLRVAEQGNHIFIRVAGKPLVLEATDPTSRQMTIENLLLRNEGIITNGRVVGCRAQKDADGRPVWREQEFVVIGRLRTAYADRLLAAVGNQRSRIGVDFVDMPTPIEIKSVDFGNGRYKISGGSNNVSVSNVIRTGKGIFPGLKICAPGDGYQVRFNSGQSTPIDLTIDSISACASKTGTALPTCTPPAMSPPENTNSSGNV
jgi:hypothetical protein